MIHSDNRHVIGMMTGTSIDGIDAALMSIEGRGLAMRAELAAHISRPIGEELARDLRRAANQEPMPAGEFARMALEFGRRHAEVAAEIIALWHRDQSGRSEAENPLAPAPSSGRQGEPEIAFIAVHGQTVFHSPPRSWQLINVSPIAERFRCPVVYDLRQADLAAGGQGAPITPMADWILFRSASGGKSRAIVNLGGFCSITLLPRDEGESRRAAASCPGAQRSSPELEHVRGFDICACNQLLDAVAREALGAPFDEDGRAASKGRIDHESSEQLRMLLHLQSTGQRSLGTGDEAAQWARQYISHLPGPDQAASACWAVARVIAQALNDAEVNEIYLAGGGARNECLANLLGQLCDADIDAIEAQGMPIEAREAAAMAVLGGLCADGVPITLPQVTGCRSPAPVAGVWVSC